MDTFLDNEDGSYTKTFAVLRYHNLYDRYAEAFQMEEISDEEVEFSIKNNSIAELGAVITTAGHRLRFVRSFQEYFIPAVQTSAAPSTCNDRNPGGQVDGSEQTRKENWVQPPGLHPYSPSSEVQYLHPENPPPPYSGYTSPPSLPSPQPESSPSRNADPWKSIVDSLQLGVTSRVSILRNVRALALKKYKECVQESFSSPTTFVTDDEVEQIREEAEDKAFSFLQEVLRDVDPKSSENAEKLLTEELAKAARELRAKNEKQKEAGKKEVHNVAEDLCSKFVSTVDREVGEGTISKAEFDGIVQDCGNVSAIEFEKLCGESLLYDPEVLEKKLPQAAAKLWVTIQGRNKILQDRQQGVVEEAKALYQRLMQNLTSKEDFQNLHTTSLEQGMKVIENSDLDHLRESAIAEYEKFIPSLKMEAEQRLADRIAKTEKGIESIRKSALSSYNEKMSILSRNIPIFEETVTNKHNHAKKEIINQVAASYEKLDKEMPQPPERKINLLKEVDVDLEERYSTLDNENRERWQLFETSSNQVVEIIKTFYKSEIPKLMSCLDLEDFEAKERKLRDQVDKRFAQGVDKKIAKPDYLENLRKTLDDFLKKEKQGIHDVFKLMQREDEVAVKSAMLEAKRFYVAEMGNRFKAKMFYEEAELNQIHDQVLLIAIRACGDVIELTERQRTLLNDAFLAVYRRYSEENICRMPNVEPAIGIDLGTTYCCVGVYFNGRVQIIPNVDYDEEKNTVASYVAFNDDGNIDVGHIAKENAYANAQHTIFDAKRLIGRKFDDEVVKRDCSLWPFQVIGRDNEPRIVARGAEYRPEEISAKVLAKLKGMAEKFLNRKVTKAVITVPAYFSGSQRQATKDAATIAGFLETIILNEPTAAAVAYNLDTTGDLSRNVLVFDLGGGTFDVAVIQMKMGKIKVLAIGGDTHLGGEDFDHNIVAEIIRRVKEKSGIDLSESASDNLAGKLKASGRLRRLRYVCEQEKRKLSVKPIVTIRLETLHEDLPLLEEHITREEFNTLNIELFEKCIKSVETTLKDARLSKERVDDIVLVGGSTRILKIQEMLTAYFGNRKQLINTLDVDTAVAIGAAYEAAIRFGDKSGKGRSSAARGIKDVTPLSLGVAVFPDQMSVIIPKNTETPCTVNKDGFSTLTDNQTSCNVRIYEGENNCVNDNILLGKFVLNGIPPAPAGQEKMECTMTIDDEGILHVEAQILTNKRMGNLSIETYNGRMTKNEIRIAKDKPLLQWS